MLQEHPAFSFALFTHLKFIQKIFPLGILSVFNGVSVDFGTYFCINWEHKDGWMDRVVCVHSQWHTLSLVKVRFWLVQLQ